MHFEPEKSSLNEPQPVFEDTLEDTRPKIIMHLPKRKRKTTEVEVGTATAKPCDQNATPLLRLSLDELKSLSQLSEAELKESLMKALEEKNPT